MMKKILAMLLTITLCFSTQSHAQSALTKKQLKTADRIAEVAIENWDEYGVLPSVAVSQAFIESTLGTHCSGNNLWGIRSGAESYPSLEAGVMRYLEVINNGYYDNAPFQTNYHTQLRNILDGGYCQPVGSYYSDAIWSIEYYNFDKYDKKLSAYTLKYSEKCPDNTVLINSKKAGVETVAQIDKYLFETEQDSELATDVILIPIKKLDGRVLTIDFIENVKG